MRKNDKSTEQNKIEADNLMEEVSEILEPCIKCGLCKSLCPVFKVLKEESVSPRGKATILSDKTLDKIVFECNLCKGCEQECPLDVKVCDAILKAREAMVLRGKGLKLDEEMIKNVGKCGNPFKK
ncbi:(Fe-S)-binding protein [Candidatus Pacearchaeota archaeon]|nr:(Fe-S)-binding protein [Candidatus Pacearchaeota archaeon]